MKKHLSIFFIAIASIIVISSVTSCVTKEDVSINSKNLVGTWKAISASGPFMGEEEGHMYMQLKEDGTYIMVDEGWVDMEDNVEISRGKWSLSGNTLSLSDALVSAGGETYPTTVTVSNLTKNSLTFVWAGGLLTINFKRVSDSTIEKYL